MTLETALAQTAAYYFAGMSCRAAVHQVLRNASILTADAQWRAARVGGLASPVSVHESAEHRVRATAAVTNLGGTLVGDTSATKPRRSFPALRSVPARNQASGKSALSRDLTGGNLEYPGPIYLRPGRFGGLNDNGD